MKYLRTFEQSFYDDDYDDDDYDYDDDNRVPGDDIYNKLQSTNVYYDLVFDTDSPINNGFKISIQGKSIEDSNYLYMTLHQYLYENNIAFKVGTQKRINLTGEQSHKVMTIYCPDKMDIYKVAEEIYSLIPDYKGWYDIKTPTGYTHYAGGLFICSDKNDGNYVSPKDRKKLNNT